MAVSTLAEESKQFPIGSSPNKLSLRRVLFDANNQQINMDSESSQGKRKRKNETASLRLVGLQVKIFGLPLNFTEVTQNSTVTKLENGFSF